MVEKSELRFFIGHFFETIFLLHLEDGRDKELQSILILSTQSWRGATETDQQKKRIPSARDFLSSIKKRSKTVKVIVSGMTSPFQGKRGHPIWWCHILFFGSKSHGLQSSTLKLAVLAVLAVHRSLKKSLFSIFLEEGHLTHLASICVSVCFQNGFLAQGHEEEVRIFACSCRYWFLI